MESRQLLDLLRHSSLGENLSDTELAQLAVSGSVRAATDGEVLLRENARGDRLVVVLEGQVEVFKTEDDAHVDLGILGPGAVVGEVGIILDHPATATVRTLVDSRIFELEREEFERMVEEGSPAALAISLSLARLLAARLQRANEHAVELFLRTRETLGSSDEESGRYDHVDSLLAFKNKLLSEWNF